MPSPSKRNSMSMRDEWSDEMILAVRRLCRQGKTTREIKEALGMTIGESTITDRMRRLGMRPNLPRSTHQHTSADGRAQAYLLKV